MNAEYVSGKVLKWVSRRFPALDPSTCEDVAATTVATLTSKYHELGDRTEWLRLGYTIAERRARDLLKAPRRRDVSLNEASVPPNGSSDPAFLAEQQDDVRLILRTGIAVARTTEEIFLWDEWAHRVMAGEPINLKELSQSIWPSKHHGHASRVLARLLKNVETDLHDQI